MSNIHFLSDPLIRSLLDETISFHEVRNAYNITTHVALDFPSSLLGFVFVSKKGNYYIVLNGNVNAETQLHTFVHELKHIVEDIPKHSYMLGIDMQHTELEDDSALTNLLLR